MWPLSPSMATGRDAKDQLPPTEWASPEQAAKLGLQPMVVDVAPGDILIFYPGWWHATIALEAPTLSMSVFVPQLASPKYLDAVWPQLSTFPRYKACVEGWDEIRQLQRST